MSDDLGTLIAKLSADASGLKSGLAEGRQQLAGFQNYASSLSASIKQALTFTVGILGVSALIGELKSLVSGVIEVGARLQTTKLAAYAVGQNFGYSSEVIDSFVQDLKKVKISSTDAYQSVSKFASHGLDPSKLQAIGQAARDLAVAADKSPQEMFNLLIDSIVTGTARGLRKAGIPIKEFQETVLAEGKSLDENLKLSAQDRSKIMLDLILKYGETVKGVGDSTKGAYSRQLGEISRMSTEAKEALWGFMEPLLTAITGEKIKVWSDLLAYLKANREELQKWGTTTGEFAKQVWGVISAAMAWTVENGNLLKSLLELAIAYKLAGYIMALAAALQTVGAAAAASGSMAMAAVAGWVALAAAIKLAVVTLGIYAAYKTFKEPGQLTGPTSSGDPFADVAAGARDKDLATPRKLTTPSEQELSQNVTAAQKQAEIDAALKKYQDLIGKTSVAGTTGKGGGKGAGKTGAEEDLVGEYQKMLEQKRQAEIQDATSSLDLLKATDEKKRAELGKNLAEGIIDGQTYYAQLQALEAGETAAALALIEQKRTAQAAAYAAALAEVDRQDLSPEMAEYRRYEAGLKNRMALSTLDVEAARAKLDGEKKVTQELTRQFDQSQNNAKTLQNLKLDSAWGPIEEQEAKLIKLKQEWDEAKAAAIKNEYTPEQTAEMNAAYAKKIDIAQFGDQAKAFAEDITSGITSITDAMISGGSDLKSAANSMFKSLFKDGFKPGLDSLKQLLTDGFKTMFKGVGEGVGSAILGVIALIGMMLTKKTSSSYSSSGLSSSVTTHEVVRGVVAGETSIDVAKISTALDEVMAPHLSALRSIEKNTRSGTKSSSSESSGTSITINAPSYDQLKKWLDTYFQDYLMTGAKA